MGRMLDPLLRHHFSLAFAAAMDQHVRTEFPLLRDRLTQARPGGVVDQQLCPWVVLEDRVLRPAARGGHVEPLAFPVEPAGLRSGRPSRRIPATTALRRFAKNASILLVDATPSRYRARRWLVRVLHPVSGCAGRGIRRARLAAGR
jgi:hypothetical protein